MCQGLLIVPLHPSACMSNKKVVKWERKKRIFSLLPYNGLLLIELDHSQTPGDLKVLGIQRQQKEKGRAWSLYHLLLVIVPFWITYIIITNFYFANSTLWTRNI